MLRAGIAGGIAAPLAVLHASVYSAGPPSYPLPPPPPPLSSSSSSPPLDFRVGLRPNDSSVLDGFPPSFQPRRRDVLGLRPATIPRRCRNDRPRYVGGIFFFFHFRQRPAETRDSSPPSRSTRRTFAPSGLDGLSGSFARSSGSLSPPSRPRAPVRRPRILLWQCTRARCARESGGCRAFASSGDPLVSLYFYYALIPDRSSRLGAAARLESIPRRGTSAVETTRVRSRMRTSRNGAWRV